jgi:DNA-binding transcriptional ArsR family regulator
VVRNSPKDAVDAVLDASAASLSTKAAHLLGQLGFAQLLAAQAASRRAGDDFFDTISSTRFRPYVELLLEGEMRNTDIAQRLEVEEETVSRALKVLRAEGITDFRRKGREVFNFLTPSASAVVGDLLEQTRARSRADQGENARVGLRRFAAVREATQETPRHFLRRQTLVPTETHETEGAL